MSEVWRPVVGHDAYEVSDHGRVRRAATGRVLKPKRHTKGYLKVHLGRRHQVFVHTLVLEAFVCRRPVGWTADHRDFDRAHNHASNLRWLPHLVNSFRWEGGAWVDDMTPPEDFTPMTAAEEAETLADIESAGWT